MFGLAIAAAKINDEMVP